MKLLTWLYRRLQATGSVRHNRFSHSNICNAPKSVEILFRSPLKIIFINFFQEEGHELPKRWQLTTNEKRRATRNSFSRGTNIHSKFDSDFR